jgi:hypothetical protein
VSCTYLQKQKQDGYLDNGIADVKLKDDTAFDRLGHLNAKHGPLVGDGLGITGNGKAVLLSGYDWAIDVGLIYPGTGKLHAIVNRERNNATLKITGGLRSMQIRKENKIA